jgi:membrane fusion protein (multidrug efflux system)
MKPENQTILRTAAAALLLFSLAACDKAKEAQAPQQPAVEVGTLIIQPQKITVTTDLPGRTSAYRIADVRPQVNGIVTKRLFREGSDVKAGQQLYQIDPATYQAALDSAKADLAKALANVKTAKAKADRYAELVNINAISKQDYDDAIATLESDAAQVASAKASVASAQINLDYTKVYSPISGRIGRSSVTEGALVTANQTTALSTVQQLDPIYVDVTQSSEELMKLRHDVAAGRLQGADNVRAPVTLLLGSGSQTYDQPGELQFSEVTVDQTSGAVTLRAIFPNPRHDLLPGLFVRARVDQGVEEHAIVVPQQAVTRNSDGSTSVWVVGEDGKVALRAVTTVRAVGNQWLLSDGLQPGEQIVVEGLQKIRAGTPVKTVTANADRKQ